MNPFGTREVEIVVTGSDQTTGLYCSEVLYSHGLGVTRRSLKDLLGGPHRVIVTIVAGDRANLAVQEVRCCRDAGIESPILLVTRPELEPHVALHAFAAGADDCIAIPFNEHEFVARTRALATRAPLPEADDLTRTERAILTCLIRNRGIWLTSEAIIREALGTRHAPDTALVRVHVHNMRRKLGRMGVEIRSRRGLGYTIVQRAR